MNKQSAEMLNRLVNTGLSYGDALALRRIAMTLHRWHELECGDSNSFMSWCITRGQKTADGFVHDDNGKPYFEKHVHTENKARYEAIADRETGAKKRLARIMSRYPEHWAYVQTDPRGVALYVGKVESLPADPDPLDLSANYTHGIAVHQ